MTRTGVLVIHGMGTQAPGFSAQFSADLVDRVADRGGRPGDLEFGECFWAHVLADRAELMWSDLGLGSTGGIFGWLRPWRRLRRWIVDNFGDAAAYQRVGASPASTYSQIHREVERALAALEATLGGAAPLIVMAHSLGGHIVSNYTWDAQQGQSYAGGPAPETLSPFARMETLGGLVTFGCNIPLFTLAHSNLVPICFPSPRLEDVLGGDLGGAVRGAAGWLNLWDRQDVLGFPLADLGGCRPIDTGAPNASGCSPPDARRRYCDVPIEDRQLNVGGVVWSRTPLAHTRYWTDGSVLDAIADYLVEFQARVP